MMKAADFDVVRGVVELIQPNELDLWDCNPIGFQMSPLLSLSKPVVDSQYTPAAATAERFELSAGSFMEHAVSQFTDVTSQETSTDDGFLTESLSVENYTTPSSAEYKCRPRKCAKRRRHGSDLRSTSCDGGGGGGEELHWNGRANPVDINGGNKCPQSTSTDQHSLRLITLLLECAVAISVDNLPEANRMLLELTQLASPYAPSCAERVVAYFAKAMASRVVNSWLGICTPLVSHKTILCSFQIFNNISPFIKFAHFTANQAILEAFHQRDRIHIIDLDIMQGLQWPALFHILATRIEGPPRVRMTGMGASAETLEETGKQLSSFAKRLGIPFEFYPVTGKFGDVDPAVVQTRRGETAAVHWLRHSLYDATGPDWKTMRLLEFISPRVVTMVEQDTVQTGSFLDRFVGSLHYYSTIFDSLGASLPCDDPSRYRVEHGLLSREVNNVLAIGGPARSGEEKFANWRVELAARRGRFAQVPMSANSMAQAQLILNMFPPSHGYTLHQGDGTLRLGWKATSLYTASAWTSQI